jgi:hypothetical protein
MPILRFEEYMLVFLRELMMTYVMSFVKNNDDVLTKFF